MQPEQRDSALLWDMREATREISEFVQDMTFADFENKKIVRYAVERQILVIGEAAKRVSDTFKSNHPEIPWNAIIRSKKYSCA